MNYSEIMDQIEETMKKAGTPLTEDQRLVLVGCISVWFEKFRRCDIGTWAQNQGFTPKAFIKEIVDTLVACSDITIDEDQPDYEGEGAELKWNVESPCYEYVVTVKRLADK